MWSSREARLQRRLVEAVKQCGKVQTACRRVGIKRSHVYDVWWEDREFVSRLRLARSAFLKAKRARRKCVTCGTTKKRSKFYLNAKGFPRRRCIECWLTGERQRRAAKRRWLVCPACGTTFFQKKAGQTTCGKQSGCSARFQLMLRQQRTQPSRRRLKGSPRPKCGMRNNAPVSVASCAHCHAEFLAKKNYSHKYCTPKCRALANASAHSKDYQRNKYVERYKPNQEWVLRNRERVWWNNKRKRWFGGNDIPAWAVPILTVLNEARKVGALTQFKTTW